MSKLEELIQQYCPDGVNFRPLGEVCSSIRTGKLNANEKDEDGLYPFFTCDAEPYRINTYAFDCEAILITGNGSQVGHINYYKGKFNAYQRTYVLSSFIETVDVFFVLHYFRAYLKEYILVNSKKGSVPYITLPMLQNFLIPIPPLPVQEEIVRVLDTFTELQAELQAELQKRLQQYNYYRDNLLSFEGRTDVEWKKLGEVANVYDGTHQTPSYKDSGIPFISVENIGDIYSSRKYISKEDFDKYKIKPQVGDVFMTRIGSIGVCAVFDKQAEIAYYVSLALIRPNQEYVLPRYLKHIIESLTGCKELRKRTLVNAVPIKVNKDDIGKIVLPFPSLSEQRKIVDILDRFDTLTNDLTAGLPAEIEKRKQQYEYYRDELLTFKRITR